MIITILMLGLIACCFLCVYRIMMGPTAPDRSVAVDILGIIVIGFCSLLTIQTGEGYLMDMAIAWTLQSYIAVLALAKYLEGKKFND